MESLSDVELLPIEHKALSQFHRMESIQKPWHFGGDGDAYMATDGRTMVLLTFGKARAFTPRQIRDMACHELDADGRPVKSENDGPPKNWWEHMERAQKNPMHGSGARWLSIDPLFYARLAMVEKACGARMKLLKPKHLKGKSADAGSYATKFIPGQESMDAVYWTVTTQVCQWQGILMPRKL